MKTTVLSVRSCSFRLKKRQFLKLISIVVGVKTGYNSDYQLLACNAKNKRFLSSKDNVPVNIVCICGQNSLFVDIIHSILKLMKRRMKRK